RGCRRRRQRSRQADGQVDGRVPRPRRRQADQPDRPRGTRTGMNPAAAAEALGSLEFAAVLEVIARRAAGPVAAARLSALRPSDDPEFVAGELRLVGELLSLLRRGERLEIPGVADIRSAVARLRVDGSVLELSELIDIRRTLAAGRTVSAELARVAELAPTLAQLRAGP